MLTFPFPAPAREVPPKGRFAVVYSPNGLRQRPTSFAQVPVRSPRPVAFPGTPYSLAWGAPAANAASSSNAAGSPAPGIAALQTYLPAVATAASIYSESTDPRVQVATYEAKIRNYQKMRTTPPYNVVPGTIWYDNEIAKMRAKLAAARQNLALAHEGEDATRGWRSLGQTALGVGIVAGIAIVTLTVVQTVQVGRRR